MAGHAHKIMKIYERIKKICKEILFSGIISTSIASFAYAAGASYGTMDPQGHGDTLYYTEGFTVHRVNWDKSNDEFKSTYGQYSQAYGGETADGKYTSVSGSYPFGQYVNQEQFGAADYDKYSIVPFKDGEAPLPKYFGKGL